jgi:serine/threonine-protein kinase RsbW
VTEKTFRKEIGALDEIFTFAAEFLDRLRADSRCVYAVHLALEELFTNMVKYSPADSHGVRILLSVDQDAVRVALVDHAGGPFAAGARPPDHLERPLEERPVGGLGLHLVRSMVDTLDFSHSAGGSTVTFTKRLEN